MMIAAFFLGTCSGSSAGDAAAAESPSSPPSDAPQVGEPYQRSIDAAWEKAKAGENPTYSCAGLKGMTMGSKEPKSAEAAVRALFACNVDIPVRYFNAYLDKVEAGDHTCMDFMSHFVTQISAMTMSTDSFQSLFDTVAAESGAEAPTEEEAQAAAESLLTSIATDAVGEEGPEDPERIVKNRLSDRVNGLCPDIAGVVLR